MSAQNTDAKARSRANGQAAGHNALAVAAGASRRARSSSLGLLSLGLLTAALLSVAWLSVSAGPAVLSGSSVSTLPGDEPKLADGALGETASDQPASPRPLVAALAFEPAGALVDAARAEAAIRAAASQGAKYLVLPERALQGDRQLATAGLALEGPTVESLRRLADELDICLALAVAETGDGGVFSTAFLLDPHGQRVLTRRAVRPTAGGGATPATSTEVRLLRGRALDGLDTVDCGDRRVGVLTGGDLRTGIPRLAERGASLVLVPASWSSESASERLELARTLGTEFRVDVAIANRAPLDARGAVRILERDGSSTSPAADSRRELPRPSSPLALARLAPPEGAWEIAQPLGLPSIPVPSHAPIDPAIVDLGRTLFHDVRLSSTRNVACSTCHLAEKGFGNGEAIGQGVHGRMTDRNVPTLWNVAYNTSLQWSGGVGTLEAHAKYPISGAAEMEFAYLDDALGYVRQSDEYMAIFRKTYGVEQVEFDHISRALASFQRTLIAGDSPFDRAVFGGEPDALSAAARRGMALFTGEAACSSCHTIGASSALLTDNSFHNTGVGYDPETGRFSDPGVGLMASQQGLFATRTLRNIALTGPYMHDGRFATLHDVVDFYNGGGGPNPGLDPLIRPLGLDSRQVDDLVAFLEALTGRPATAEGAPLVARRAADARAASVLDASVGSSANGAAGRIVALQVADPSVDSVRGSVLHAAANGAALVVLPAPRRELILAAADGPANASGAGEFAARVDAYGQLAADAGVWLSAVLPEPASADADSKKPYVTQVLFDATGQRVHTQRRLDPGPSLDVVPGRFESLRAFDTPMGRLGVAVGDDLERAVPRFAELGADTVLVSASWSAEDPVDRIERAARLAARWSVDVVIANRAAPEAPASTVLVTTDEIAQHQRLELPVGALWADLPLSESMAGSAHSTHADVLPRALPLGLPPLPVPSFNRLEAEKVALGQRLFFDPRLSAAGTISCADCHQPEAFFADGLRVAVGVSDRKGKSNVPTLVNSAYRHFVFWRGDIRSLEAQVEHALQGWNEMNTSPDEALAFVRADGSYREAFARVTGREAIRFEDLTEALAAYERTLIAGGSDFDRYAYGGVADALNDSEKRGLALFTGKATCSSCHAIGSESALFTDHEYHNTGVGFHPRFDYLGYQGDGLRVNVATANAFVGEYLTPPLRDISRTAPYMHDGSLATLADVVDHYDRGGVKNKHLDPLIQPLDLTAAEKDDLIAFLHALDSHEVSAPLIERRPTVSPSPSMIASHRETP